MAIVVATSVLHNIAINMGEEVPLLPEDIDEENLNQEIFNGQLPQITNEAADDVAAAARALLINDYFNNL